MPRTLHGKIISMSFFLKSLNSIVFKKVAKLEKSKIVAAKPVKVASKSEKIMVKQDMVPTKAQIQKGGARKNSRITPKKLADKQEKVEAKPDKFAAKTEIKLKVGKIPNKRAKTIFFLQNIFFLKT